MPASYVVYPLFCLCRSMHAVPSPIKHVSRRHTHIAKHYVQHSQKCFTRHQTDTVCIGNDFERACDSYELRWVCLLTAQICLLNSTDISVVLY